MNFMSRITENNLRKLVQTTAAGKLTVKNGRVIEKQPTGANENTGGGDNNGINRNNNNIHGRGGQHYARGRGGRGRYRR